MPTQICIATANATKRVCISRFSVERNDHSKHLFNNLLLLCNLLDPGAIPGSAYHPRRIMIGFFPADLLGTAFSCPFLTFDHQKSRTSLDAASYRLTQCDMTESVHRRPPDRDAPQTTETESKFPYATKLRLMPKLSIKKSIASGKSQGTQDLRSFLGGVSPTRKNTPPAGFACGGGGNFAFPLFSIFSERDVSRESHVTIMQTP